MSQRTNKPWEDKPPLLKGFFVLLLLASLVAAVMYSVLYLADWNRIRVFARYLGGDTTPFSSRQSPPGIRQARLQVDELTDLETYLKSERKILGSYQWVDKKNGVVRIPIDRAIEILAERGLPTRGSQNEY